MGLPKAQGGRTLDGPFWTGERLPERVLDEASLRQPDVNCLQGRVILGGALSGRDTEAVNKTVSGLVKLLFPDPEMPISDRGSGMDRAARARESAPAVKEQQKRVFKSEFRNTHFSYTWEPKGWSSSSLLRSCIAMKRLRSDPLPPGQVWAVEHGHGEAGAGLYRIEMTTGPGGGVKILNQPSPPAFRESVRIGEQNLYTRAKDLVGDRDPREQEFSVQMRAMDTDKSGVRTGTTGTCRAVRLASWAKHTWWNNRCRRTESGGSIEMIPNAVAIAELAVDKQAQTLLMPVAARKQLNELPDDVWTRLSIEFYRDASDAVFKALLE